MATEHDHVWGPVAHGHFTGEPHRKCQIEGCTWITLDLSDECDCGDFDNCDSCGLWAEKQIAEGWNPYSGKWCGDDLNALRNAETRLWNGALAGGNVEHIERLRNIIATNVNKRIMADDPNYQAAGYQPPKEDACRT